MGDKLLNHNWSWENVFFLSSLWLTVLKVNINCWFKWPESLYTLLRAILIVEIIICFYCCFNWEVSNFPYVLLYIFAFFLFPHLFLFFLCVFFSSSCWYIKINCKNKSYYCNVNQQKESCKLCNWRTWKQRKYRPISRKIIFFKKKSVQQNQWNRKEW